MINAEYAFDILKEEYDINDDNVAQYRWALSFKDEYAEYVQEQAQIIVQSINLGQSVLSLGELMRPLFNATHKMVAGNEYDLPGVEHFISTALVSSQALNYIASIAEMTEDYATCMLACEETIDISYG